LFIDGTRDIKNIVMVDIDMSSFTHHLRNGIFIEPFNEFGYEEDRTLELLNEYLNEIVLTTDSRKKIQKDFELEKKIHNYIRK
jgi:hypothetical protein